MLIDPGAAQTELLGELPRVDEPRSTDAPITLAEELGDALGDRFDCLGRELLDGCA
ncbi:MAG TPA: hypothetical protein VG165_16360 [Solirubrobacteraceae bacterium]|nr:hypothetical protein [Solirubrobacteraceae bacterium]